MTSIDVVRDLVETFSANLEDYKRPGFKEAHLRSQFLDRFFEALGWDVGNRQGFAEQYKEVVVEDTVDDEGRATAPDYCFRVGRERKFFVEAKKPIVDIGTDRSAAYQLRRYAWSAKLPISIVTDFEELSVYDTRARPERSDGVAVARVKRFHYEQYIDRWQELSDLFSKEAVLKGSFDRYAAAKVRRGTAEVDDDFLATLEVWRLQLANAVHRQNPSLKIDEIAFVVQNTLDRILFLRICEDKGIEPFGTLRVASSKPGAYEAMLELFRNAQQRYNSGLFHLFSERKGDAGADGISASIKLSDAVVKQIIAGLYHPNPYEFSVLSTEILGSVYERFLGSELVLSGRAIEAELKPEQKKAGGVYYTPSSIARYMVDTSLAELFKPGSADRPRLRILDMACGSGSFLIHAYDELLRLFLDWHRRRDTRPGAAMVRVPRKEGGAELRLSLRERKRILCEHVFGIDIDRQATEVTKLSLFLKLIEDVDVLPVQRELGAFQSRILPDLSANIKCGNSIVSEDVYEYVDLDDEEIATARPLSWEDPEVFGKLINDGGFDLVIGNPPYAYRKATIEKFKSYYDERYAGTQGNYDIYKMFLERATEVCRSGGTVCQIVNSSFMIQPQFEKLREVLLDRLALKELAVLGPNVFKGVTIDTAIVRGRRRGRGVKLGSVTIKEPSIPALVASASSWEASQERFASNVGKAFDWRVSQDRAAVLDKVFATYPPLRSGFELSVGINTGSMKQDMVAVRRLSMKYHACIPGTGVARYGPISTKGFILYDPAVVKAAGRRGRSLPPERFFDGEKLLVVRTRNTSLKRRIIATLDAEQSYHLNRLTSIIAKPESDLRTLLAILNSTFMNYIFLTRYFNYEVKPVFLREVPIPTFRDGALSDLVDHRLSLEQARLAARTPSQRSTAVSQIAAYEQRIDSRVFELYGLAEKTVRDIQEHLATLPGSL